MFSLIGLIEQFILWLWCSLLLLAGRPCLLIQYDMFHSQEKCQHTKTSQYQHEITSEKCSDSHLHSYRNQADVLNFLSQQSEYWPIKCIEVIHCRTKAWPGLVFYARIIMDWETQPEIGNMFSWLASRGSTPNLRYWPQRRIWIQIHEKVRWSFWNYILTQDVNKHETILWASK